MSLNFSVERAVVCAGAEICAFQVSRAERSPSAGAEDSVFRDIVHVNWDAQHGGERDVEVANVAVGHDTVVCAPVVHDLVSAGEGTFAIEDRSKPSGWPSWVGALVEGVVDVIWEIHRVSFRDLEGGAESTNEVEADHGRWHAAACAEAGAEAAAGEVFSDRWVPSGGFEAFLHFRIRDVPEGFHGGLTVDFLLPGAVESGGAGVDQVEDAVANLRVGKWFSGCFRDGVEAPVGAEIGENLCAIREQVAHEHAGTIERVVFRGDDVGRAFAIPVEGGIEDRLEEIAVWKVVSPLPLALEASGDGVVALGLFAEAHFCEFGVSDHQVAGDERHFHAVFPFRVDLFAGACAGGRVAVAAFWAVGFDPRECHCVFCGVVLSLAHAADEFREVDCFDAHSEPFFPECRVDDRAGDAHGSSAHGEVAFAAHERDGESAAGEAENFFADVSGDFSVGGGLDILAVDSEGGEAFLRVSGEDSGQVNRAGALGAVESPDCLGQVRIHVHGL